MGKKRINQLLEQLKQNQQQEIQNAAAIYTVAQIAIQELQAQTEAVGSVSTVPSLPPVALLTRADLEARYGSYNECRKAAKQLGIRFQGSPRWSQLVQAFEYHERLQGIVSVYMAEHPAPELTGLRMEIQL